MNSNFNLVKKPKKDENDFDEEEEVIELDEDKPKTASNNDEAKKKMFKFMGIIVGITIVVLIILYLCSILMTHKYTYEDIETVLKDASVKYFEAHEDYLPVDDGDQVEVDSSNLVVEGYMKNLSEYLEEGVTCTGKVIVEKSGDEYLYTPYLSCGDTYSTEELYSKITNEDNIVTSGYGLYSYNGAYIYRGEEVNNYVQLENSLWRIVKVTSNNNIVLISNEGIPDGYYWDDRYNENKNYDSGINTYSASRVKEYLTNIYTNPSADDGEELLSSNDKAMTVSFNLCTGKRTTASTTNDNSEECSEVLQNQKYGLLTLSDYLYASIDTNCKSSENYSCSNYNYLSTDYDWWLVTANKDDDSEVFQVGRNGKVSVVSASNYATVRPVIYLNSKVLYAGGSGTADDPYTVR